MASGPQPGDVIVRNLPITGYEIVEANGKHIAGPFESFVAAYECARVEAKGAEVWQQTLDDRGRPVGPPGRVTPAV